MESQPCPLDAEVIVPFVADGILELPASGANSTNFGTRTVRLGLVFQARRPQGVTK